jgi:hypothetical protein
MNAPANGHTAANIAEQRRAAYQAAAMTPHVPQRPARVNLRGKLPTWLITAALGLLVGTAAALAVAYQVMPIAATQVQRVFADVDGDGTPDLIVSGWVVFAPKADGQ